MEVRNSTVSLIELQLLSIVAIFPFPRSLPCQLSILHGAFVRQNSSHGNKYFIHLILQQIKILGYILNCKLSGLLKSCGAIVISLNCQARKNCLCQFSD